MAEGVTDAEQPTLPAPEHNGRNGYIGQHRSIDAGRADANTGTNNDSAPRPDKGKQPEWTPHPMDIDSALEAPRAEPASGPRQNHGDRDGDSSVRPADDEDEPPLLPVIEHPENEDWDAIEANWHAQRREAYAIEDKKLLDDYTREEAAKVAELQEAIADHNRLLEDLFQARVLVDGKVDTLHALVAEYEKKKKEIEDGRDVNDLRVRSWIVNGRRMADEARRKAALQAQALSDEQDRIASSRSHPATSESPFHERLRGVIEHDTQHASTTGQSGSDAPGPLPDSQTWEAMDIDHVPQVITDVVSANGATTIGQLLSIPRMNHWIDTLMLYPVLRSVEIRLGRKFTPAHLKAVYEGPDLKKSKWLSFMIQATGQVQDRACHTCAKGQGLFSLCIIVGGLDFPRCGNCEWNKHGCHGAAGPVNKALPDYHSQSRLQQRPRPEAMDRSKPVSKPHVNYKKSVAHYTKAMNLEDVPATPTAAAAASQAGDDNVPPSQSPASGKKNGKTEKPASSKTASSATKGGRRTKKAGASTSGNAHLLTPKRNEDGEQSFLYKEMTPFDATEEITEDTLVLRHDGMIYLEPELMRGVPRRKISPEHAYWDPGWKDLETYVKDKHDEWVHKLSGLRAIPDAALTDKDRTAIFQAGRQINRGTAILRYLANCDTHPYQLVSKTFITPSFTHYDTLFRMVATIDELGKFRLSVSPIDWLRHRLYEIQRETGDNFKLDRVIAKLYHDPKLSYLRSKNGFGNIGRPSVGNGRGAGGADGSGSGVSSTSKRRGEKRREARDSAASTPTQQPAPATDTATADAEKEKQGARDTAPRSKRQKTSADVAATAAALAPASVTASTQASRPVITPRPVKNSVRSRALAALASRVLSASPALSATNDSEQESPQSTTASSRAVRRNVGQGQCDGADDLPDGPEEEEDSKAGVAVASHHVSHNYGGYTDSEDDDNDDHDDHDDGGSDSDMPGGGRTRMRSSTTRNGHRKASRSNRSSRSSRSRAVRASRSGRASRAPPDSEADDLDYSGYTSRDSLTDDAVVKKDWRVLQVKTRELTSNPRTTQYWHWVDERHAHQMSGPGGPSDLDPMFEHQVLKETEPTTGWGVFREPINFHLRLRELTGVRYAPGSTIIVIGTAEVPDFPHRGDVLARFKRERSKRRFLVFMKKKGVALHKVSRAEVDAAWEALSASELMPGNDSD